MRDLLARIAGWCVERPAPVLAAVALLALIGGVGALRLAPDAGTEQLVDRDSAAFVGTEKFKREFGDDAVVVLDQLARVLEHERVLDAAVAAEQQQPEHQGRGHSKSSDRGGPGHRHRRRSPTR